MAIFYDYVLDELRLKDVPEGSGGFWGSFYDTTTQTISSTTTEYPITLNTTSGGVGVAIGSPTSKIVFSYAGIYSLTFSVQFDNSGADDQLATIWLKKNGNNLADSSSVTSIPKKHGSDNGAIITTINYVLEIQPNDYLEVYWRADSTNVRVVTIASGTSPTRPLSPSIIFTAVQGGIISQTLALSDLTDVDIQTPTAGEYLQYDGSNWTNAQIFSNIDGGSAQTNYLLSQNINGGNA